MYSWELKEYLEQRCYILSNREYIHILKTCPQINHIEYNAFENNFDMWTDDGSYFKVKVYHEEINDKFI